TFAKRVCRVFCRDDGKCAGGEHCVAIGKNTPADGLCIPTGCALFSTTCPAGFTCDTTLLVDGTNHIGLCRSVGNTAAGADCTTPICAPDPACVANADGRTATCKPYCDSAHACPSGSCKALTGLANGGGYCP